MTIEGTLRACKALGFSLSDRESSCELGRMKKQNIVAQTKTPPNVTKGRVKPPSSYRAPPTVGPKSKYWIDNHKPVFSLIEIL